MIYNYLKLIGVKRTIPYFGVMRLMQFLFDVKTIVFKMYLPIRFFWGDCFIPQPLKLLTSRVTDEQKKRKERKCRTKNVDDKD